MPTGSPLERFALGATRWIGSTISLIIHTFLFIGSFLSVMLGFIHFEEMLLVLTTIVSLEAIYLSIFIQMSINHNIKSIAEVSEDIDEIQEDIGEIQEDVEEISEDVDELQEDVEEISEDTSEDELRDKEHQRTLADIQRDLRTLMNDIDRLKKEEDDSVTNASK